MQTNTYLFFDGQCADAFAFYASCLDGTVEALLPYGDHPDCGQLTGADRDRIMHACLSVGSLTFMGSDSPPGQGETPRGFAVNLSFDDNARAEEVFKRLAQGGRVTMPLAPTFWAEQFGMLVDRFGIPWMINGVPAASAPG